MLAYRLIALIVTTGILITTLNNRSNTIVLRRKDVLVLILLILIVGLGMETTLYLMNPKKNLHQWVYPKLYGSVFNDASFPPLVNIDEYYDTVKRGYDKMKETRLMVGGLCKNNASSLPVFFARMMHWSQFFKSMRVVLFENDSVDDTRQVIRQWQQANPDFIYLIPCPNDCRMNLPDAVSTGSFSMERMQKMAMFRNKLLAYAKSHRHKFDTLSMIDVDLCGPVSMDGMAHSFGLQESLQWDCISSYGLSGLTASGNQLVYYDSLAYKELPTEHAVRVTFSANDSILKSSLTTLRLSFVKRGAPVWAVASGFCGMALYQMSSIESSDIWYDESGTSTTCEHITFHERMSRRGHNKHYVNPNMILLAGLQGKETHFSH